ncbi:MAG: hypothetical protein JSV86_11635 [Gemmatimonadota bacterium]|nr:MAG: hypothetical protein JSV86_11635 [Gemmatimonadota bacterium]
MSATLLRRLVPALAALALACSYETDGQMTDFQNFAVFTQSPGQVVDALTAVLVESDALSADVAAELGTSLVDAFATQQEAFLNSQSVALATDELARLVPEEYRHFIGEEGGRYVLELTLKPAADGGLRVEVTPTIIATVRGGEGPLGGRPLPSNGTLENSVLQSLTRRLGG